jgi:hypothetical protein
VWDVIDVEVLAKVASFAANPDLVVWSRSTEHDIADSAGMTRVGVLAAILDHLECGYIVHADYMKNGDLAFILPCLVDSRWFYIKVKFIFQETGERMKVFSAHPDI